MATGAGAASATLDYWVAVAVCGAIGLACCWAARARPASARRIGAGIALVLGADAVTFLVQPAIAGHWRADANLPLALCDLALVIAAISCWLPGWQLGVELTYFWGLAGTAQAVLTPDLSARFPSLQFVEFVLGHVGIVTAACFLVIGLGRYPRPRSVRRVFILTAGYSALVGVADWLLPANYMFLARPPAHASLLSVLGPWPWYLLSAAALALLLLMILDLPFRRGRRRPHPAGRAAPVCADQLRRRSALPGLVFLGERDDDHHSQQRQADPADDDARGRKA